MHDEEFNPLISCEDCGCLMLLAYVETHARWHEEQSRSRLTLIAERGISFDPLQPNTDPVLDEIVNRSLGRIINVEATESGVEVTAELNETSAEIFNDTNPNYYPSKGEKL